MELHTDFSQAELIALAGAIVTAIAAFLPWVAGVQAGPVDVNATQTGIEGLGLFTLLSGVGAIGAILLYGTDRKGPTVTVICGLIVAALSLWKLASIGDPVSPGVGLYLSVLAGIGIIAGGGLAYRDRDNGPRTEVIT